MLQLLDIVIPAGTNKATKKPYKRVRDVVSGGNLYSTCEVLNSILASHTQNKMNIKRKKLGNKTRWGFGSAVDVPIRHSTVAVFSKLWCIYY